MEADRGVAGARGSRTAADRGVAGARVTPRSRTSAGG